MNAYVSGRVDIPLNTRTGIFKFGLGSSQIVNKGFDPGLLNWGGSGLRPCVRNSSCCFWSVTFFWVRFYSLSSLRNDWFGEACFLICTGAILSIPARALFPFELLLVRLRPLASKFQPR